MRAKFALLKAKVLPNERGFSLRHKIYVVVFFITVALSVLAAKNETQAANLTEKWNPACQGLLETAVSSTLKLEKTLNRKKKKLSQAKFNEKIQSELMVVQLNAWVCAVSSDHKVAALIEKQFLQEYANRVQNKQRL